MGRAHLREDLVQPLQRPVQVYLYPARGRRHVLAVVLRPPALHKRHPNRAHFGQLVHGLETMVHALRKQLREFPIIEDLQGTARRDLTHSRRMETVVMITIAALNENRRIRQAFRIHFPTHVVQMHPLAYMTSRVLYRRVTIDVAQLAQAEPVAVVGGICETIDYDRVRVTVEHFTDSTV